MFKPLMSRPLIHPRDEIMRAMERIYRYRMTTTSGGNISVREKNGDMWITPARVDKGSLRREDIVLVRADGSIEGLHRPSSEYPFHQAIYKARPDVRGIVHAHPVALVAFSIVRKAPDTRLLYQARSICKTVGFAPYALPGSAKLGANIAQTFARGFDCVILENHGVVTAGPSLQSAFERFETLEFAAKTAIKGGQLGKLKYLRAAQFHRPSRAKLISASFNPPPATSQERELRRLLCEFVHRAYQQRLMISTEGAFSARLDERSFLITRHHVDRHYLTVDDIVLVRDGKTEKGKTPSRAAQNHAAIYRRHPEFKAIVNAYPVNATAFAVTGSKLDSRTIPESYIFLRDVSRVPFGIQFGNGAELARVFSPENPIALLENDGVMVCGTSILDAFDRLEVLESTAEAMINSRPIGRMAPMANHVIKELIQAFFPKQGGS
jgi:L-fuculose-phosphate aldolase